MIFGLLYKQVGMILGSGWGQCRISFTDKCLMPQTAGHSRHPSPAQRVAAEEGSQKDGPVTVPLAQHQFSMNGVGLLEWILEGESRGLLVYGWRGGTVEAVRAVRPR
jgi:hypothetical protein